MVCIECFVVPILFVVAAYFKQLMAFVYSRFFQADDSSNSVAPPPFNPSMINLAAHGLPAAKEDSSKLSASASVAEEKEGPASTPQDEADSGEISAGGGTVQRRK